MAISRKGMRRITVDGVEYFWSAPGDRVTIVTGDGVEHGQHGRWIRFAIPHEPDLSEPSWWEDHRVTVTPRMVQRAIEIARRRGAATDIELTTREMRETIGLELLRIEDELGALTRMLEAGGPRADIVPRVLAVGCRDGAPALLDDWTACNSEALMRWRLAFQYKLDHQAFPAHQDLWARSAVEFLVTMCKRVGIELVFDMRKADERTQPALPAAPWGIPDSHWWWTGL